MTLRRGSSFLKVSSAFIIWTALSFLAYNCARHVINAVSKQRTTDGGSTDATGPASPNVLWFCILVLTLFQIGIGTVVLLLTKRLYQCMTVGRPIFPSNSLPSSPETTKHHVTSNSKRFVTVGHAAWASYGEASSDLLSVPPISFQLEMTLVLSHLIATATTNASIAFATPASAFAIKAFEPITTAVLSALLGGKRVETHVIVSLPLVVIGAIGFTWRSDFHDANFLGIFMAVVSNIMYGLRNIGLKSVVHDSAGNSVPTLAYLHILGQMSIMSGTVLVSLVSLQMLAAPDLLRHYVQNDVVIYNSMLSGLFHVSYTIISVVVMLSVLSVVAHATANLGKRVIISLLFCLIGWQPPTFANVIFGLVFLVGLAVYLNSKDSKRSESQECQSFILTIIFAVFVLAFAFFPGAFVATTAKSEMSKEQRPFLVSTSPQALLAIRKDYFAAEATNKTYFNTANQSNIDFLYQNYQKVLSTEEKDFLNVDLFHNPDRADWLSKRLPEAHDVILEAQRIHQQLFSRLLKGYKRAVFVNAFNWVNRGDHLIMIGERVILSRFNLSLIYYCFFPGNNCNFKDISRSQDLIVFIQGGGYIGDTEHVPIIRKAIEAFPENRVIFFPISVCCTSEKSIAAYQNTFNAHRDLLLLLRDRVSYEISKKSFPQTKCYLSPDTAFAVGSQRLTIVPTHDIIWLKRNDWENYGDKIHDQLPIIPKNITALIQDWDSRFMSQVSEDFLEDHQLRSASAFIYLARGKVVISDRLHAHIMAMLLGKPSIVVNSKTRKQQNYYDTWEKSIKTSACVDSAAEAFSQAKNFIETLRL